MRKPPGINRRHRRASMSYLLSLKAGEWQASLSAKAAYQMARSVDRTRRLVLGAGRAGE